MPIEQATATVTQKAIEIAVAQVGKPYRFGAAGPNAFDCSGLLWWSFKQAGANVSRFRWTTGTMLATMTRTDPKNPMPGDFLFPHTEHVVMYIGGGKIVEAPRTGLDVRIQPYSSRKWLWARRYGQPGSGLGNTPSDIVTAQVGTPFDGIPIVQDLTTVALALTNPHNWLRVTIMTLGGIMVFTSLIKIGVG